MSNLAIVDHVHDLNLVDQRISTVRFVETLKISRECVVFNIHEHLGSMRCHPSECQNI